MLIRFIPISLILLWFSLFAIGADAHPTQTEETQLEDSILCLPGIYLTKPDDCLDAGPSAYLTELARQGIILPLQALPAVQADANLAISPYFYARLKNYISVPVYPSLEDAVAGRNPSRYIEGGELRYISYIQEAYVNNRPKPDYFQLRSGGWVSASGIAQRENAVHRFQGLTFRDTPDHDFGWILPLNPFVETKQTPGYEQQDYSGHVIYEYQLVPIYHVEQIGETEWYLIGPNEWLEGRLVGRVTPNPIPPEGVTNGRWIEINLAEQILAVYEQNQLIFATLIATGLEPFYTRPGLFSIYKKHESTPMWGAFESDRSDYYYLEDVPWTLYYDKARALHGAYWRTRFGFPQSHGCVNLSPGDAHWLFNWAQEGDWVYVWDPSGKTPVDPAYYTEGGA